MFDSMDGVLGKEDYAKSAAKKPAAGQNEYAKTKAWGGVGAQKAARGEARPKPKAKGEICYPKRAPAFG